MNGHTINEDALWPRDLANRFRLYGRLGDELTVLATASEPGGIGAAIVQLHEDAKVVHRRLCDHGRIGVLDVLPGGKPSPTGEWIIPLYDRGGRR